MTTNEPVLSIVHPSTYYEKFLEFEVRPDGRRFNQARSVEVLWNVFDEDIEDPERPQPVGSALVVAGKSQFLSVVSAEIAALSPENNCGSISVVVEYPKSCGALARVATAASGFATTFLSRVFNSPDFMDFKQLIIEEGRYGWALFVKVICISFDGISVDWPLMAAAEALRATWLPGLQWCNSGDWWRISGDSGETVSPPLQSSNKGNRKSTRKRFQECSRVLEASSRPTTVPVNRIFSGKYLVFNGVPRSITIARLLKKFWATDPSFQEFFISDCLTFWQPGNDNNTRILKMPGAPMDIDSLVLNLPR